MAYLVTFSFRTLTYSNIFDVVCKSDCLPNIAKAIDRYVQLRTDDAPSSSTAKIDPRLQEVIENILARCIEEGEHRQVRTSGPILPHNLLTFLQAIGIALDSRRLDVIERIYGITKDVSLLSYAMEAVVDTNFSLSYRNQVLHFLLPLFPRLEARSTHIHSVTRLLVTLSDAAETVKFLLALVPKEFLLAYQLAFDLVEGGSQDFLETIRTELPQGDDNTKEIYDNLRQILTGRESVKLYLQFLKRNNKVDMLILKNTKVGIAIVLLVLMYSPSPFTGCSGGSFIDIPQCRYAAECIYARWNNV